MIEGLETSGHATTPPENMAIAPKTMAMECQKVHSLHPDLKKCSYPPRKLWHYPNFDATWCNHAPKTMALAHFRRVQGISIGDRGNHMTRLQLRKMCTFSMRHPHNAIIKNSGCQPFLLISLQLSQIPCVRTK